MASWGLLPVDCAHRKSRWAGFEPLLGAFASATRQQPLLIPFGEAPLEATNANAKAVVGWIEPQDDGTCLLLLRRSRQVF
jgi:hypothetical protein